MNKKVLIFQHGILNLHIFKNISKCTYASSKIISELKVEDVPEFDIEEKHSVQELEEIMQKSRLRPCDRNILYNKKPEHKNPSWLHDTVYYRKRMLGSYGIEAAGFSPGICWPTKEEIDDKKEYEKLVYPNSIQEEWKLIEERKKEEALEIQKREEEIEKVVVNFDKWRAALDAKIAKKEAAILEAKKKKEMLMMQIRDELGYVVDPKDERFLELMEEKSKEEKKKKKEEKKKLRQQKLLEYLKKAEDEMLKEKDEAATANVEAKKSNVDNIEKDNPEEKVK